MHVPLVTVHLSCATFSVRMVQNTYYTGLCDRRENRYKNGVVGETGRNAWRNVKKKKKKENDKHFVFMRLTSFSRSETITDLNF